MYCSTGSAECIQKFCCMSVSVSMCVYSMSVCVCVCVSQTAMSVHLGGKVSMKHFPGVKICHSASNVLCNL